jgi:hypothetical protein
MFLIALSSSYDPDPWSLISTPNPKSLARPHVCFAGLIHVVMTPYDVHLSICLWSISPLIQISRRERTLSCLNQSVHVLVFPLFLDAVSVSLASSSRAGAGGCCCVYVSSVGRSGGRKGDLVFSLICRTEDVNGFDDEECK